MRPEFLTKEALLRSDMARQGKVVLAASIALNLCLALCLVFYGRSVQTFVLPVTGGEAVALSPPQAPYLNLLARDFVSLAADMTAQNADFNRKALLSNTSPALYGELEKELLTLAAALKNKNATIRFDITDMETDPKKLTSVITGYRKTFIGGVMTRSVKAVCRMAFEIRAGRVLITQFVIDEGAGI